MFVARFLPAVVLICSAAAAVPSAVLAAAPHSRFRILYHEELQRWSMEPVPDAAAALQPSHGSRHLVFEAFGRRFDASLERNERLLEGLDEARRARLTDVELYRGSLAGQAGTWVRVSILRGRLHGLIWDGTELFAIEPARDLRYALETPVPDDAIPVIFRLRDMVGSFHDVVVPAPNAGRSPYDVLVSELQDAAELTLTKRIDVGVIGDVEFLQNIGTEADLLARMNNVDGIFSEQVGVQIYVAGLETFDHEPDPFTSTAAEDLLNSLAAYRLATPSQQATGLTHLFTGRDLGGTTIGIAYLGEICDPEFSAGLTQADSGVFLDSLTAAHEIGHNFGAPHDGEQDSPCAGTPRTFLMSPELNGSDQFSACSLEQMAPVITSAGCLGSVVGSDVSTTLAGPASVLLGALYSVTVTVANTGPVTVHDAALVFEGGAGNAIGDMIPLSEPMESCSLTEQEVRCTVGSLGSGESRQLSVMLEAVGLGSQSITSRVSSALDTHSANNSVVQDVNVTPGAALLVYMASGLPMLGPGGTVDMEVSVHNDTSHAATGVEVDLSVPPLEMASVNSPDGSCAATVFDHSQYTCDLGTMQSQADAQITLTVRAPPQPLNPDAPVTSIFTATARANEPLSRIEAATASTNLTVYPAIADLALRLVSAPDRLDPSQRVRVVVALDNLGPNAPASPVTMFVGLSTSPLMTDITSTTPGCSDDIDRVNCTFDELAAGETRTVEVTATAPDHAETIYIGAKVFVDGAFDAFGGNNELQSAIEVGDTTAPPGGGNTGGDGGGGGGGGAAGDLLLIALLALRAKLGSLGDCARR